MSTIPSSMPLPARSLDDRADRELALVSKLTHGRQATSPSCNSIDPLDAHGRPRKQSDVLVDIGKTHASFRGVDGTAYVRAQVDRHHEVHRIDGTAYREILAHEYLRIVERGCNRNALADAVTTLSARARFNGDTHRVWVRTAAVADGIVIDMGGPDWQCIEVNRNGWGWCKSPPMFRRAGAPLSLPTPAETDFSRLWNHVNVAEDDRVLVAAFLLASLRPSGPYPQLVLAGEQGAGKSTLARMLKALIDPSASPLRAPPKKPRDLLVAALNGWCLALDNVSHISPQLSDALCRLATGGAISERKLFTNTDEVLVEVQRPVILNGIEDLATRPDLADRGLHVECDPIPRRRSERDLWAMFGKDAPHIFSALLNGLTLAQKNHQNIDVGPLPRMADFATWAAAGVPALGFTSDQFMRAYRDNIATGQSAGIESSPVGQAVVRLMEVRAEWTGTATGLSRALARVVDHDALKGHAWPKSPRGLSGAVRRLAPALRAAGVNVTHDRSTDSLRAREIHLCNATMHSSEPSGTSKTSIEQHVMPDDPDGLDDQTSDVHNESDTEVVTR